MTIREQIGKKCKPCAWAIFIGVALIVVGLFLQSTAGGASGLVTDEGRLQAVACIPLALVVVGYGLFVVACVLLSLRECCPRCGRNIGPFVLRRANYCSLCGISLDTELPVDKINAATVRKQQRKEWLLHLAHMFPGLLYGVLLFLVMTLFIRILHLEGDRSNNAKPLGRFYAHACKTEAGEKIMRRMFTEQLSRAQTSNYFERWLLPKYELVYRQKVLDAFEKELGRIKGNAIVTEENIQE